MGDDANSGQHPAGKSRNHPARRENVVQFTHLLQTQIYFFYDFFDRDENVLCLAGASKATNQSIKLLRGTPGALYFGSEGAFGLCRYQSLQMVATSCRLRNKIYFLDRCQADTSHCVEFIVTSVQRACFLAGAPRDYFLATMDTTKLIRQRWHCLIPSLHLNICMKASFNGWDARTWFEDMFNIYDEKDPALCYYRGLAFPVACGLEPFLIPSAVNIEPHHLHAINHCPTFFIVIWKSNGTAVTPVEYLRD